MAAHCEEFALHFEGKIAQVCSELDSTIDAESEDVSSAPCLGQILMDEFQLLRPNDVDRVLVSVWFTTIPLDPLPILANWEICQGDSYTDPGGRECLLERGSGPYCLEIGSDSTTP